MSDRRLSYNHRVGVLHLRCGDGEVGYYLDRECDQVVLTKIVPPPEGESREYRLSREGGGYRCTCKGHQYRGRCKHSDALSALDGRSAR